MPPREAVFVNLLRFAPVRHRALELLLQFLGYSFPTVRQATAQALYIRLRRGAAICRDDLKWTSRRDLVKGYILLGSMRYRYEINDIKPTHSEYLGGFLIHAMLRCT